MGEITNKIKYHELQNNEFRKLFKYTNNETIFGMIQYDNGDVYIGEIQENQTYDGKKDKRRHGYGKVISKRGKTVDGEWNHGVLSGNSIKYEKNGRRLVEIRSAGFKAILYEYYINDKNQYDGDKYNGLYKSKYFKNDFIAILERSNLREQLLSGNVLSIKATTQKNTTSKTNSKVSNSKTSKPKDDKNKPTFERVTFKNGDVYEGEMLNGYRHGKGKYIWNGGDYYEGEWKNGKRNGYGIYQSFAKNEIDGTTYVTYRYEGEWKDSKKSGRAKSEKYKVFNHFNFIYLAWSYEGMYLDDSKHGKGIYKEFAGDASNKSWIVYEGEWINDEKDGLFIWQYEPNYSNKKYINYYQKGERVVFAIDYDPNIKTLEDALRAKAMKDVKVSTTTTTSTVSDDEDDYSFTSLSDYYNACVDCTQLGKFDNLLGDEILFHEIIPLDIAIAYLDDYFQSVIDNFAEMDFGTGQEILADILQIEPNKINDMYYEDGIFSNDTFDLFDACSSAIKAAYIEYVETWENRILLGILHFTYYLYKTYGELNGYDVSGLFCYYLTTSLGTGFNYDEYERGLGALYLARIYEYGHIYVPLDSDSDYYELELRFGDDFSKAVDHDYDLALNLEGCLIDQKNGFVFHEPNYEEYYKILNSSPNHLTTKSGNKYYGYTDDEGNFNCWGMMHYLDGDIYLGEWKDGYHDGFGIEYSKSYITIGYWKKGVSHGYCFDIDIDPSYFDELSPLLSFYYENGNSKLPPEIYELSSAEYFIGSYSKTYNCKGQIDKATYAHGHCCLWEPKGNPVYIGEGMYDHGTLKIGIRIWYYQDGTISFTYGKYKRNSDNTGYYLYTDSTFKKGFRGKAIVKSDKIELVYFDEGSFYDGDLEGRGTRIYSDGLKITGFFSSGKLETILEVIKPNGKKGNINDYQNYIK